MDMKKEIMAAYFDTLSNRTSEGDSIEKGMYVEDNNGKRFVVEAVSHDYEDVKSFDHLGQGEAWIRHNDSITESQTWVALKDIHGEASVNRYSDDGVTKIEEQDFDRKPEHVKVDRSIMEAYASVITPVEDDK